MKRITAFLLFLLIIFESAMMFSSCAGKNFDSEMTVKYLTEYDYLSSDFENKPSESLEVGVNEKCFVVVDVTLTGLKKSKKRKNGRNLLKTINPKNKGLKIQPIIGCIFLPLM